MLSADTDMSAVFLVPLQKVFTNDPEYKQHLVRYCYDTQCFLMGQSDYAPYMVKEMFGLVHRRT